MQTETFFGELVGCAAVVDTSRHLWTERDLERGTIRFWTPLRRRIFTLSLGPVEVRYPVSIWYLDSV